jgi:hypothetical protein
MAPIRILCLIVALGAIVRAHRHQASAAVQQLGRWKYVFAVIAALVAMLLILNPEFLAISLLGDTAFFDLFVLALTLQLHLLASGAWKQLGRSLSRRLRSLMSPNTAMGRLVLLSGFVVDAVGCARRQYLQT